MVSIPTVDGKADYNVTTAIKNLRDAVTGLETKAIGGAGVTRAEFDALRNQLAQLERAVQQLARQVSAIP